MRKLWMAGVMIAGVGLGATVLAAPHIYKWVKDKRVNSERVLPYAQRNRVIPLPEPQALEMVRQVMADDLFLAVAEYHPTKHIQDGETTADSVMPEEVVGQGYFELEDEDYRFFLEVKLRDYSDRTRVTAKASPIYRYRDYEAEDEAYGDSGTASGVDLKVRADEGSAVSVGPIFVMPSDGNPSEVRVQSLPIAAERSAQLVRSFLYLLDKRVAASKTAEPPVTP